MLVLRTQTPNAPAVMLDLGSRCCMSRKQTLTVPYPLQALELPLHCLCTGALRLLPSTSLHCLPVLCPSTPLPHASPMAAPLLLVLPALGCHRLLPCMRAFAPSGWRSFFRTLVPFSGSLLSMPCSPWVPLRIHCSTLPKPSQAMTLDRTASTCFACPRKRIADGHL